MLAGQSESQILDILDVVRMCVCVCAQIPFLFQDEGKVDNVFLTCCILHNMLLDWSGRDLSKIAQGNWHAKAGKYDANDERLRLFESEGLGPPGGGQDYDSTRLGFRKLPDTEIETDSGPTGWADLRRRLVVHYSHRYDVRHDLHWLG